MGSAKLPRPEKDDEMEITAKPIWQIETVDRYNYSDGRNRTCYVETTFWYNPETLERKETTRYESIYNGNEYKLPEWAKFCITRRKSLESI